MIFLAYLCIETALIASMFNKSESGKDDVDNILTTLFVLCKFSSYFGLIFLMLLTCELFPTSLRCTGMALGFTFKCIGSFMVSSETLHMNESNHRLGYGLATLFFGALSLFLPETKAYPLPRSILQVEAMETTIGRKLMSRKVQLACEKRHTLYKAKSDDESAKRKDDSNDDILRSRLADISNINNDTESNSKVNLVNNSKRDSYDTVSSVHDIEQDGHMFQSTRGGYRPIHTELSKISENPNRDVTRSNSILDASEFKNSKL